MTKTGGRKPVDPEVRAAMGQRIRDLRDSLALTQQTVAERGRFERQDMSRFEKGEKLSSADNQRKLALGFGIPSDYLSEYIRGRLALEQVLAHREVLAFAENRPGHYVVKFRSVYQSLAETLELHPEWDDQTRIELLSQRFSSGDPGREYWEKAGRVRHQVTAEGIKEGVALPKRVAVVADLTTQGKSTKRR